MMTKYYKAVYRDRSVEVFVSDSPEHAREYALTLETGDRKLDWVAEYDSLYDALTKD